MKKTDIVLDDGPGEKWPMKLEQHLQVAVIPKNRLTVTLFQTPQFFTLRGCFSTVSHLAVLLFLLFLLPDHFSALSFALKPKPGPPAWQLRRILVIRNRSSPASRALTFAS